MSAEAPERVFGIHTVQTILKSSPDRIVRLLVAGQKNNSRLQKIVELAARQDIAVEKVTTDELDALTQGTHQGVCALCVRGETHDEKWLYRRVEALMQPESDHAPLLLILDGVTDPHNLGACLRTADAVGVDAVIIPKDNSAGLTPVVQKVASGAAESVPLVIVTNLARCMSGLQERGIWITGTSDQAEASLFDAAFDGALALAMGAEGDGLRRLTRERCDHLVSIPMQGVVSSLNVSVAAGVCLYEIRRQRQTS